MNAKVETSGRVAVNIPEKAPSPLGSYSHAIRAGQFLYLSGQGARDPESGQEVGISVDATGKVTAYDIEAQTQAVIKNMGAILEAAGLTLKDLVDVSVFLADIADFPKFNKVYSQYFAFEGPPARTTVQAAALPGKNFIEIKAVAFYP